jgi:hypothetical protein
LSKPIAITASEFRKAGDAACAVRIKEAARVGGLPFGGWSVEVTMPPSVNHAYATVRGRRVLSAEGRAYKKQVREMFEHLATYKMPVWFQLSIRLFVPLHYKNGPVRRFDASNRIKLLEDAVCEGAGIDDCRIRRVVAEKTNADREYAIVALLIFEE